MRVLYAYCSLVAVLIVALPTQSFAQYLDPGTGSYIFQLLIAGGAALFYTALRFKTQIYYSIKHLLHHRAEDRVGS